MIRTELAKGVFEKFPLNKKIIERAVEKALYFTKLKSKMRGADLRIHVRLVGDKAMHKINLERRGKDKPTDVLSFPLLMWEEGVKYPEIDLGELYLDPAYIRRKPELAETTLKNHVLFLTVHGILHLLGYDHMIKWQRETMEKLEDRIIKSLEV